MPPIDRLTEYFAHFPGIGPRQAKRFVYYLLTRDQDTLNDFTRAVQELKSAVRSCNTCFRFFSAHKPEQNTCNICAGDRSKSSLMIVPRDSDLEQIEKTKAFDGLYFVLGGTVPILDKAPETRVRIEKLKERINKDKDTLTEVILATNLNPEGEHTMEYIESEIKPLLSPSARITHLGRGFSTGTEIEYSDSETIKYALKNRF